MKWSVRFEKRAKKDLANLPKQHQKRVLAVLPLLENNPYIGKKLEGEMSRLYSYRVWPYRIIYRVVKNFVVVIIVRVGHRQGVYKR